MSPEHEWAVSDTPDVPEEDWRLTFEESWMNGAQLERRRFTAPTPDWDHEHCCLCGDKFMDTPSDELHEGLVYGYDRSQQFAPLEARRAVGDFGTIVGAPAEEKWICETCFVDFEGRFHWTASEVEG